MKARYAVLGAPKDLIGRCLFNCRLHFQIRIFQIPSLKVVTKSLKLQGKQTL